MTYPDFMVAGDRPLRVDEALLSKLNDHLLTHAGDDDGASTPDAPGPSSATAHAARTPLGPAGAATTDGGRGLLSPHESAWLSDFLRSVEGEMRTDIPTSAPAPVLPLPQDIPLPSLLKAKEAAPLPTEAAPTEAAPLPTEAAAQAPRSSPPVPPTVVDDADVSAQDGGVGRRRRHMASEQRRRNQIRECFTRLSELLEVSRGYGARALGLNSGAGTGVEDEVLDDRTDTEEDLFLECDEEELQRRKRNAQRRARSRVVAGKNQRGRGRGRGGSAGGAGSKSAILFQVIDLLDWLEGHNARLHTEIRELEDHIQTVLARGRLT